MTETSRAERLTVVLNRIREAEQRFQRATDSVALLAVSKTKPAADVAAVAEAGQQRFGENYLQEALDKMDVLQAYHLEWHFIGPVQSNKTRHIAERFDWVHSVDRLKIAQRLSGQRPDSMKPLNICLQINIDHEDSKSGFTLNELADIAPVIAELPGLCLRGLMALPAPRQDFMEQRQPFARLREAQQALIGSGMKLDTLSIGMSDDLEAAIAEGATIVRVGTAVFGPRLAH